MRNGHHDHCHEVVMTEDSKEAEAAKLLKPPPRIKLVQAIKRAGQLGLAIITTSTAQSFALAVAEGVGLGVAGNAAYELAKAAVISYLRRSDADASERLNRDEAYAVALWAITRKFRQSPDSAKEHMAQCNAKGQWNLIIMSRRFEYHVTIPPGRPDVDNVEVRRRRRHV